MKWRLRQLETLRQRRQDSALAVYRRAREEVEPARARQAQVQAQLEANGEALRAWSFGRYASLGRQRADALQRVAAHTKALREQRMELLSQEAEAGAAIESAEQAARCARAEWMRQRMRVEKLGKVVERYRGEPGASDASERGM